MPPSLKDQSAQPTSPGIAGSGGEAGGAQPVALEVAVTVNGARAVEGSEKREPFSETTSTVLVLANGAVIRLSSSVAPGQLLFLTNEKTKREVVCQVVKSKNYGSASGYVELEFTQPVPGFWGMRFPGERGAPVAGGSFAGAQKSESLPSPGAVAARSEQATAGSFADTKPAASEFNANLADAVQEFKTEVKADGRASSKADFLAPSAEASTDGPKLEANRLQEQLSALLLAEQQESEKPASTATPSKRELGDAAAKVFEMANEEPAPVKVEATPVKSEARSVAPAAPKGHPAKSSFDDEEVKIPAWLEPLARNAAIPAPPEEVQAGDSTDTQGEQRDASKAQESETPAKHAAPVAPVTKSLAATAKRAAAAPMFGGSLLNESAPKIKSSGSSNGIWLSIAAALILAVSGGWYFRDSLTGLMAGRAAGETTASPVVAAPASATVPSAAPAASTAPETSALPSPSAGKPDATSSLTATKESASRGVKETAVSAPAQGKVQTAAITERIAKTNAGSDGNDATNTVEIVEPDVKKPSLGKVRLAKPKVGHSAGLQGSGEAPTLDASEELGSGGNSLGATLGESSNQPAAPVVPVPVGGEVKPARMISSVPPVYPAMAKTQHVGGDVRIDALIDANGRVTTMKVVSGPSLLHQAAMDALRQWKYQPATLDGKAVPMHLTVTLQFRLQ